MMERRNSVEIQAISVDEAVRLALEQLGRARDEVEIEVLAEPSNSAGGYDEEALVRVTVRGFASQPTGRPSGGRGFAPRPRPGATAPPARLSGLPVEPEAPEEADEATALAMTITRDLLATMGFTVRVIRQRATLEPDPEEPPTIMLDVLGDDLGMLIGRRGEHLAQLQYLVNLLVNRRLGQWTRVSLDVEGYKRRREESLIGLAERVAKQVARSGRAIQLEPMPPNERRIVHLILRDDPNVTTESSGEGDLRRVAIAPRAAGRGA